MGLDSGKDPREFVEGLNLGYQVNRDFAESAIGKALE
jgi:hypothetical protein